jgi:hypothetical protein
MMTFPPLFTVVREVGSAERRTVNISDPRDPSGQEGPRSVVDQVRKLGCQVNLKRPVPWPFALLGIDVPVLPPQEVQPLPEYITQLVDGILSCSFAYDCTRPRTENAVMCNFHKMEIMAKYMRDNYQGCARSISAC